MTLIQIKGVVERRFYCNIPDEFLFSQLATLQGIASAVKLGELTTDQRAELEAAEREMQGDAGAAPVVQRRKEPFCPWWTCCY